MVSDGEMERWEQLRKALVDAGLLQRGDDRHVPSVQKALFLAVDIASREAHRTPADKAAETARAWLLAVMSGETKAIPEQIDAARILLGERR